MSAGRTILTGGAEIAEYTFGDSKKAKMIYRLASLHGLPTFKLGGVLAARPERLDEWLAAQESDAGAGQGVDVDNAA